MSNKILISTSLRILPQVLTLIKCCFLGGFFFLAIHQHYMSKCPKGINFLSIHWNYNVFKIKAYRIISPSQKSRIQHVPLIKYPIKINNKNFHNLISHTSGNGAIWSRVSRLLQLRKIRSWLIVSKNEKNHPPFRISQLQHVTPDKSQFLFLPACN